MDIFIERAISGLPLLYHGSDSRQQDFTYVDDIAESIALATENKKVVNVLNKNLVYSNTCNCYFVWKQ